MENLVIASHKQQVIVVGKEYYGTQCLAYVAMAIIIAASLQKKACTMMGNACTVSIILMCCLYLFIMCKHA